MKQIFAAIMALMMFSTTSFAQTAKPVKAATATATTEAKHLKKDGTADKRFKENKNIPAAKHVKKDGTLDKRFKENKAAVKKAA